MTLPSIISLSQHGGSWEKYLPAIYQHYLDSLVNAGLTVFGVKLSFKYKPAYNSMHFNFWHLISEGEVEEERLPNLNRCSKILWIRWVLDNFMSDKTNFKCWKRHNDGHIVIWYVPENYVVVLAQRPGYVLLKTAYPVTFNHTTRNLSRDNGRYPDPRP